MKEEINTLIDSELIIKDYTILIAGNLHEEVKYASAQKFTINESTDAQQHIIDNNQFYPQALLGSSSCIG